MSPEALCHGSTLHAVSSKDMHAFLHREKVAIRSLMCTDKRPQQLQPAAGRQVHVTDASNPDALLHTRCSCPWHDPCSPTEPHDRGVVSATAQLPDFESAQHTADPSQWVPGQHSVHSGSNQLTHPALSRDQKATAPTTMGDYAESSAGCTRVSHQGGSRTVPWSRIAAPKPT
jgi:hypothetical protein